ncbi:MAG: ATP-grasp domain-containing protein [bacterium]
MITDFASAKKYAEENIKHSVVGIGVNAYNRVGLERILPHYSLACLVETPDNRTISHDVNIVTAYKNQDYLLPVRFNSTSVLKNKKVQRYIAAQKNPAIFFYTVTHILEELVQEHNWPMIANPKKFGKEIYENKVFFRKLLKTKGLPVIPGETNSVKNINFSDLQKKYQRFVVQIPDLGGGKGTFFINNEKDWQYFLDSSHTRKHGDGELVITKFITGPSPSMTGVVTKHGVVSSRLVQQMLSAPECVSENKGSGTFFGHDFAASDFFSELNNQAIKILKTVGEEMKKDGFKGIFGIDFLIDKDERKVYPVECNPRLLGSFPAYTMAQEINNEVPFVLLQVLEFLNYDYEIAVEEISAQARSILPGAHFIIHNLEDTRVKATGQIKPGVYNLKSGQLNWLREGYHMIHIKNDDEFIITGGLPETGSIILSFARMARVLTKKAVLIGDSNSTLNSWGKEIVSAIRNDLPVRPLTTLEELDPRSLWGKWARKIL